MIAELESYFDDAISEAYDEYVNAAARMADAKAEYNASYSEFKLKCSELAPFEDLEEMIDDLSVQKRAINTNKKDFAARYQVIDSLLRNFVISNLVDYKGIFDPRREINITDINITKLKSVDDCIYELWEDVKLARQNALQETCGHNLIFQSTVGPEDKPIAREVCALCQIEDNCRANLFEGFLLIGTEANPLVLWLAKKLSSLFAAREEKDTQKMQQINAGAKKVLTSLDRLVLVSDRFLGFSPEDLAEAFKKSLVFVRVPQ